MINKSQSCCTGKVSSITVTGTTSGGTIWGSNPYTDDSDMARAAVHAGILTNGQSGAITLTGIGSVASFTGTSANGVTTSSYGSWCGVQLTAGASTSIDPCATPPPPPAINCTALISGCAQSACIDSSSCTSCLINYGLNSVSSTSQNCLLCSSQIFNCAQCTVITACTTCDSGYYVITDPLSTPGLCDLCSSKIQNCLTCSDNQTCLTCSTMTGYKLNTMTNLCECDVSFMPLINCATCSTPSVCMSCTLNFYFLNSTDNRCQPCSDFDIHCLQCSSDTFCTTCMTNYGLNYISSTQQNCLSCSSAIANCLQCTVTAACITCTSGYYVITDPASTLGQCDICNNKIPNCLTCSDNQTCLSCASGYILNSTSKLCNCNVTFSPLTNCLICSTPIKCTSCTPILYFLNSTDDHCHPCSDFDSPCLQCSNENICTSCQTGYQPKPNPNGKNLCVSCSILIPQCATCSSLTICTDCNLYFGINSTNQCEKCDALLMPGCLTCENDSLCLSCSPKYVLINGVCIQCSKEIYKCNLCYLNPTKAVQCSKCQNSFYLSGNQCKSCLNIFDYCSSCNSVSCSSCLSPYILGNNGKCNACVSGYSLMQSVCMNIPGCKNSVILPNGTQVCIACAIQLNFVFDSNKNQCVCNEGYVEAYHKNSLKSCQAVCGDGILLISYEECDDKNVQNGDGCDSNCIVQNDFICSLDSPSKCVLNLSIKNISFNYVSRVLSKNEGILSFSISPMQKAFQKLDWPNLIKFNFSSSAVNPSELLFTYSSIDGNLLINVPYTQALQDSTLKTIIIFDPTIILSSPDKFQLINKLNGINAPLTFQGSLMLQTHKNVGIISFIMVIFLLLQFYLGSYFHKMIGLETIQVIQGIYFVRMISKSTSTSVLYSMNIIQHSTTGYENAEIIYGPLEQLNTNSMSVMKPQFTAISMKPFFLLNTNLMLIPVFLATFVYLISLTIKYYSRNKYLESKEQTEKDNYRDLRRLAQWVFDHFLFPYVMMFNLFVFFFTIEELSKKPSSTDIYDKLKLHSFPVHLILTFMNFGIYCYEIFFSLEEFTKYRMTEKEREKMLTSMIEKMEHDENNPDRANYHPAYVLVYLIYYLLLSLVMVLSILIDRFKYSLQLTMGLSIGYFLLICIWQPYSQSINAHNHFLKVYYGTFVLFLVICYMFAKVDSLPNNLYISLMYVIMFLVALIMTIGFVRIVMEKLYRKRLDNDNTILQWVSPKESEKYKSENQQNAAKVCLLSKNSFLFKNQLLEMKKQRKFSQLKDGCFSVTNKSIEQNLSKQQEFFFVNKIRQEVKQRRQNFILDQLINQYASKQLNLPHNGFNQPKIDQLLYDQKISQIIQSPLNIIKKNKNMNEKNTTIFESEDRRLLRQIRMKLKSELKFLY